MTATPSGSCDVSGSEEKRDKPDATASVAVPTLRYWRDPGEILRAVTKHCMSLPSLRSPESVGGVSKILFRPNQWVQTQGSFFLKLDYPTPQAVLELCSKILKGTVVCSFCASRYYKDCPLLTDLNKTIDQWSTLEKLPPCIRLAWVRKSRRLVVNYLVRKGALKLPLWGKMPMAKCETLKGWGLCQADIFCQGKTPLQYNNMRIPAADQQPAQEKGGKLRKTRGMGKLAAREYRGK